MTNAVRTWLAECYGPGIGRDAVERDGDRASAAAAELRRRGRVVDYLGALFVADDEVAFHAFAAPEVAPVRAASRRAGLPFERIVEAVSVGMTLGRDDRRPS